MQDNLLITEQQIQSINLRSLKNRNQQMDQAIKAVQSRINYMKSKEQKTVRRVIMVKKKLTSLEVIRKQVRDEVQMSAEDQRRQKQQLDKKLEYNKLIKEHLKFNKKIVMTLMNHKVTQEVKNIRDKNQQLKAITCNLRQNLTEQNNQKANKVRMDYVQSHEKRKLYFLQKLKQFKHYKQHKLKDQIKQRQKQESIILQLEEKERALLQRLGNSEKFRMRCQDEYEDARRKYKSFYEAARGISRDTSIDYQGKADIFIS